MSFASATASDGGGDAGRGALRRWRGAALAFVVVVAGAAAPGCTSPGDDPGPPIPVDPAALYAQMCARCHGQDGRGDAEMKKTLPVRDFTAADFLATNSEELARTIMAGKNQMPAFGNMLSVPKIQSLSGYVKRLGRASAASGGGAAGPHGAVAPIAPAPAVGAAGAPPAAK